MAVSGHKSIQSLALYTRVGDDEKIMMGLKLTYSLLKPAEARALRQDPTETEDEPPPKRKAIERAPIPMPVTIPPTYNAIIIPAPVPTSHPSEANQVQTIVQPINEPPLHALDPRNNNVLPLENALVPYEPDANNTNKHDTEPQLDFDFFGTFN